MEGISFPQAVEGRFLYACSRMSSACTVADYANTFRRFQDLLAPEDPPPAGEDADGVVVAGLEADVAADELGPGLGFLRWCAD